MKRKQLARIDLSNPDKPKIIFNSVKAFNSDLMDFKHNQRIWVQVETYSKTRSLEQNKVLHWYINEISEETGQDPEDIKDVLKNKFLKVALLDKNGEVMADNNGEVLERVRNTSELNTLEFNEFTEKIRLFAQEFLNLYLPLPNEEVEFKFNDYPTLNRENI